MSRKLVTGDFQDEIDELISLAYTDKDDEELKGILVTSFDFKLYFVIRKYIDWETGWVGDKGIAPSRNTLIKAMQEKRVYGSNKEVLIVTEGVIRASIKRLEKAGFLVVHSVNTKDEKRLIFFLPKAVRDESVNFTNNRGTTDSEQPEENIDFTGSNDLGATGEQPNTNARDHKDHNIIHTHIGEEQKKDKSYPQTKYKEIISDYGFDLYALTRDSSLDMYKELTEAQVLEEDVRKGIEQAHLKKGKKPDAPAYYKNFILSAHERRLKNANNLQKKPAVINGNNAENYPENFASKPESNHTKILGKLEQLIIGGGSNSERR